MGRDNRVHYLRKQSWATKSNSFRKIKTPGMLIYNYAEIFNFSLMITLLIM